MSPRPIATLTILTVLLAAASLQGAEQIEAGDTVVVSSDQAKLGVSGRWLAGLERGTKAKVLVVKGDWVGVSVVVDGETLKGAVKRGDVEPDAGGLSTPAKNYWPQFHGPRRDNISDETGFLKEWPDGGPKRIWTADNIGFGYATVSIAEERIFSAGEHRRQDCHHGTRRRRTDCLAGALRACLGQGVSRHTGHPNHR